MVLTSGVKRIEILTFFNVKMGVESPKSKPRRGNFGAKRGQKIRKFWIGGQKEDKNSKKNPATIEFQ